MLILAGSEFGSCEGIGFIGADTGFGCPDLRHHTVNRGAAIVGPETNQTPASDNTGALSDPDRATHSTADDHVVWITITHDKWLRLQFLQGGAGWLPTPPPVPVDRFFTGRPVEG